MPSLERTATPHKRQLTAAVMLALLLGGCVTAPTDGERGAFASARRVLGLDFGTRTWSRRVKRLRGAPDVVAKELRRTPSIAALPTGAATELRRINDLSAGGWRLLEPELRRHPKDLGRFVPTTHDLSQNLADDLYRAGMLFGPGLHPLDEIDDRRHRTDPNDDRPEMSLLDRVLRRLRL